MAKTTGLIKIQKDGEILKINPKMLPQHEALGWSVVDENNKAKAAESGASPEPALEDAEV